MSENIDTRKRLLIVDDDDALCQMLAWAFEDLGYQVERAPDCCEGERRIRHFAYDVILLDYHLPDGNGDALMRRLRGLQRNARWGLMSADSVNGRLPACLRREPAMPFFAKPISPSAVDAALTGGVTGH